ncbi:hypothetical protein niasHS_008469 [Heterodera schachtii]|uniref:Uncharacterized protein n=1 Tax=Heterodera schachtii TaxID=97005 RepID=A0ABD2IV59_HETSC
MPTDTPTLRHTNFGGIQMPAKKLEAFRLVRELLDVANANPNFPSNIQQMVGLPISANNRDYVGLLCAVDCLKSPPNIREIVGLAPPSNVRNAPLFDGFTMDDLLNKAVQIVSIVCQWPETTLKDLDGFLKTLALRSTSVRSLDSFLKMHIVNDVRQTEA